MDDNEIIYNNYINNYSNYINNSSNGISSLDLLLKDRNDQIVTFCREIDQMLNGGIPLKKITEFCGIPGIGKTQMAFQLLVNTSIPIDLGGVQGKAIYIDTEGSYSCQRVREMANHLINHLNSINQTHQQQQQQQSSSPPSSSINIPTVDEVLNNIFYYRVYHYIEIISLVHQLPLFLEKNKDVRLIVVDSITYPFRRDFTDMGLRTRCLLSLAQNLMTIATRYNLSVVVINQVTTKISPNQKESILVPYLGESWTHICTYRMILFWKSKQRYCHLYKSPSFKSCFHPYEINEFGIRSLDFNQNINNYSDNDNEDDENENENEDDENENENEDDENKMMIII